MKYLLVLFLVINISIASNKGLKGKQAHVTNIIVSDSPKPKAQPPVFNGLNNKGIKLEDVKPVQALPQSPNLPTISKTSNEPVPRSSIVQVTIPPAVKETKSYTYVYGKPETVKNNRNESINDEKIEEKAKEIKEKMK